MKWHKMEMVKYKYFKIVLYNSTEESYHLSSGTQFSISQQII